MLGKVENGGNDLSQVWETTETQKNTFPKLGKTEIQRKLHFPNLGRPKIAKNNISQHWESKTII